MKRYALIVAVSIAAISFSACQHAHAQAPGPELAKLVADSNAAFEKAAAANKWNAVASCATAKDGEAQKECYRTVREMGVIDSITSAKLGASQATPAPAPQVVSTTPTTWDGWLAHGAGQLLGGIWDFGKSAVLNLGPAYLNARVGMRQAQANEVIAGFARDERIAVSGHQRDTVVAGFQTNAAIAANIQAPQPNIFLNGQGVIGGGTYTYTGPVTRNCNGGTTSSGSGGGTTTGAAGGAGGSAAGGNC